MVVPFGAAIGPAREVISLPAFMKAFHVSGANPQDQYNLLEKAIEGDRQHQHACLAYSCAIVYRNKEIQAGPNYIRTYVDNFRNAYQRAGRGRSGDVWKDLMKVAKELDWFTIEYYNLFNFSSDETTMELAEIFLKAPMTVEAYESAAELVEKIGWLSDWNESVATGETADLAIAKEQKETAMHEARWKQPQAEAEKCKAEAEKCNALTKQPAAGALYALELEHATKWIQSGLSKDDVISLFEHLRS